MTEKTTIRNGYDTWVSSTEPTSKHPRDNRLRVKGTTTYAYVYFPLGPELRGNTITTAPLHLWGQGVWTSATVTAKRIVEKWDASTLTWNNKPGVGATTATLTQANSADPTEWVLDLASLVSEFASGSRWYGIRLEITDTVERRFNSLNAATNKPYMQVFWNEPPAAPVDLSPAGGRAVSVSRPTLSWSNEDSPDGSDFSDFEVQIDPAANGTSPALSLVQASGVAELDLTETAYAGLANLSSTQWRVRVRADGIWSAWSDWASFMRDDLGTVTLLTPGTTVAEFTPPVAWSTSFTQKAWRLIVTDLTTGDEVHNTGRKTGATQDYTIPQKDQATDRRILRDGRDYRLEIRAFDDKDREATSGAPAVARAVVVFHYADDPTPNPVTNLSAQQVQDTPYVDLTWVRKNADGSPNTPDGWTITANGRPVEVNVPGADLIVTGASFKYRFKDARPSVQTDYRVKPVVNGGTGPSPLVSLKTVPTGLWVLGPDDIDVLIGAYGNAAGSFSMPDRATTIELPQAVHPVRIIQGVNGLRGEIPGVLYESLGLDADEWADRMLRIKRKAGEEVTIYFGEQVVRAQLTDILVEPTRDGGETRPVSFGFFEAGVPEWLD